jgi:hypothetical protein
MKTAWRGPTEPVAQLILSILGVYLVVSRSRAVQSPGKTCGKSALNAKFYGSMDFFAGIELE